MQKRIKALIVMPAVFVGLVQAAEVPGRFVGTVDGLFIDEPIVCYGKESPDSFFQKAKNASNNKESPLEIGGGRSGKYLNLIVRGRGVDLRTRFKGVTIENGKVKYAGSKKRKNGKDHEVNITFWCEVGRDSSRQ